MHAIFFIDLSIDWNLVWSPSLAIINGPWTKLGKKISLWWDTEHFGYLLRSDITGFTFSLQKLYLKRIANSSSLFWELSTPLSIVYQFAFFINSGWGPLFSHSLQHLPSFVSFSYFRSFLENSIYEYCICIINTLSLLSSIFSCVLSTPS